MIPHPLQRPSQPVYANGLFAAPWASEPVLPPINTRPGYGYHSNFAPALGPHSAHRDGFVNGNRGGPDQMDFMSAIRDQAIFAWALTGINGTLAEFSTGKPTGESQPKGGLPIWATDPIKREDSHSNNGFVGGYGWNGASKGSMVDGYGPSGPTTNGYSQRGGGGIFGDPGLNRKDLNNRGSRSDSGGGVISSGGTPYPR
ncbi:hypothetical protein LTR28_005365 [Elasticomyces elasticus]|nr:hypothetical protein LTR28_005365 [Elasticomyces elasticus]